MTKSDTYIEFIIDQLNTGNVERGKVLAKFVKKWQVSDRTFDRMWKTANEQHKIEQDKIKAIKQAKYSENENNALKGLILTKNEKREYLRKVIHGEITFEKFIVVKGEPKKVYVKADAGEIMKAIDIDNKMEGDYATIKTDVTTNGETLNKTISIKLPTGEDLEI